MKNLVLGYLMAFLLAFSLTTSAKPREKAENDTDVWLTEGGEERSLKSQPLPPMAMKMKQTGKVEDGEAGGDEMPTEAEAGEEEQDIKKACKADSQKTHPVAELGTSMGKCYIPDSIWSKTCKAVMAVNEHYKSVESKVDPSEVEEAMKNQQIPARNPECNELDMEGGVITRECKSCTLQLKPNAFGVQLTCYECQLGKSDKTCHYIIKDNPKFIVSSTFFDMMGFEIPEMEENLEEISGSGTTSSSKDKKIENMENVAENRNIPNAT